jgi:hypothetical protein
MDVAKILRTTLQDLQSLVPPERPEDGKLPQEYFVDVRQAWFETPHVNDPNTWSATKRSKEMRDEMNDTKSRKHSVLSPPTKPAAGTSAPSLAMPPKYKPLKSEPC